MIYIPMGALVVFFWGGLAIGWVWVFRHDARWRSEAHKMAQAADLSLPTHLEPSVMRYVRNRSVVGFPVLIGVVCAVTFAGRTGTRSTSDADGVLLGLAVVPAVFVVLAILPSLVVRWRAQGASRVAHVERLTLRDVTTLPERWGLVLSLAAACAAAVLGSKSLAPDSSWVWVPPLVLVLAGACCWWYARTTLAGRSSGSNVLELAWDDALRIRKVREALVALAFLLPIELVVLAAIHLLRPVAPDASGPNAGAVTPIYFALIIGLGMYNAAVRENRVAYRSWRKLWPQAPKTPSTGAAG